MIYIELETGRFPVYRADIKQAFPNLSLPDPIPAETLAELGYGEVIVETRPEPAWDEKVVQSGPVQDETGTWRLSFSLTSLSLEEKEALLAAEKLRVKAQIDTDAGEVRKQIGSQGYGQEMTYIVKVDEARQLLADPEPVAENYPMIFSEIGITGPDAPSVATTILELHALWKQVGAAIEAVRLGAKAEVDQATSPTEIASIYEQIQWPTSGL